MTVYSIIPKNLVEVVKPHLSYEKEYWSIMARGGGKHKKIVSMISPKGVFLSGFQDRISKLTGVEFQKEKFSFSRLKLKGVKLDSCQKRLVRIAMKNDRGIFVAPTGVGKTVMAAGIISVLKKYKVLFLCSKKGLVYQTVAEFNKFLEIDCQTAVEGELIKNSSNVCVATIQTAIKYVKYFQKFDVIIVDECFHKDTRIKTMYGEKRICEMNVGDHVYSEKGVNKVVNIFTNKVFLNEVCKAKFDNGEIIYCSRSHLFKTNKGWLRIDKIKDEIILTFLKDSSNDYEKKVPYLQKNVRSKKDRTKILFKKMLLSMPKKKKELRKGNGEDKFRLNKARKWVFYGTSKDTCSYYWMGHGVLCENVSKAREWVSKLLQIRFGKSRIENRNRSGWPFSLWERKKIRFKKRGISKNVRLESIEVYKQGNNDESFLGIVGDKERSEGHVRLYDLEVENDHSYYANDFLVHNCQHVCEKKSQYWKFLLKMKARKRFGLTATPQIEKEKKMISEGLLGPIIGTITEKEGKKAGRLSDVKINIIDIKSRPDWNWQTSYFWMTINKEKNKKIVRLLKDRENESFLIMVVQKHHGELLQKKITKAGIKCVFLSGKENMETRTKVKNQLNKKEIVVIATNIWDEGENIPTLENVILAGGGKSQIAVLQKIGRGTRKTENKCIINVWDFHDKGKYLENHSVERFETYKRKGWCDVDS